MPLTFKAPKLLSPRINDVVGGQIDVGQTVFRILGMSYIKNNLGIDLVRKKRRCINFNFMTKLEFWTPPGSIIHGLEGKAGFFIAGIRTQKIS